jgi:hypothetical protein
MKRARVGKRSVDGDGEKKKARRKTSFSPCDLMQLKDFLSGLRAIRWFDSLN